MDVGLRMVREGRNEVYDAYMNNSTYFAMVCTSSHVTDGGNDFSTKLANIGRGRMGTLIVPARL